MFALHLDEKEEREEMKMHGRNETERNAPTLFPAGMHGSSEREKEGKNF